MDRYGVIWTRASGTPEKLADMVLTPSELRITKTREAGQLGLPGPCLLHDKLGVDTIEYQRDQWHHLPPQLETLLPPANRDNPQRIILSKLLARHVETRGMPVIEQEWEMLLFAGRGATGHLDVFKSDQAADRYYALPERLDLSSADASALWGSFRRIAENTANDDTEIDQILEAVGPTPGISGFNPKLFSSIPIENDAWTGGVSPSNGLPVIIKVDTTRYPGLIELESLAYELHRDAKLRAPRTWLRQIDFRGERFPVLAIERFDRTVNGTPVPMESVFSLLRTGSPGKFFDSTDGSMEDARKAIAMVSTDQAKDRIDLFSRFALSFIIGNGDLHLENWVVLGSKDQARLSPVFDPAPMRAYRSPRANHDLLSALPFSGIGGTVQLPFAQSGEIPRDLATPLIVFGESIGIGKPHCRDRLAELLSISRDYADRAIAVLEAIPADRRKPRAPDIDGFRATLKALRNSLGA